MNNIEKIELFLNDKKNSLIILPKVSAEIVVFYQLLIQKIVKRNNMRLKKISDYKDITEITSPSLFGDKQVYIVDNADTKNISKDLSIIEDKTQKFFVFMNYASYKKNLMRSIQINTYDFKKDMLFFLEDSPVLPLWNDNYKSEFLNFSHNAPHLFFSELDRLKIKILDLSEYASKNHETDTILSIRKDIFKYKNEFSIKFLPKIYDLLKREIKVKKLNF